MTFGRLRPVGEIIGRTDAADPIQWPAPYSARWVDCGTTALGVAIRTALRRHRHAGNVVVLPGYTCPDVVSAAVWAEADVLLVDTAADSPWFDDGALERALDETVAAVVAPHFLGIPQPLARVAELCKANGTLLIEDSAQLGPGSGAFRPSADLVVLSFGRGKPVPVGGGLLLASDTLVDDVTASAADLPARSLGPTGWKFRRALQNLAMTRHGFRLVSALPGLGVGETRYRPLGSPSRLRGRGLQMAERVLAGWRNDNAGTVRSLATAAGEHDFRCLTDALGWDQGSPLLRMPVLAATEALRDQAVHRLRHLGGSAFYRHPLPAVNGVPSLRTSGDLANASGVARRLFTLPCHSGVTGRDIEGIRAILEQLSAEHQ